MSEASPTLPHLAAARNRLPPAAWRKGIGLACAAALLAAGWTAALAQTASSDNYVLYPAHESSGGGSSDSSAYTLGTTIGQGTALQRTYSASQYQLGAGLRQILHYPNVVSDVKSDGKGETSITTVTVQWSAPGYDGALGDLQQGSSYYIVAASYTTPNPFALDLFTSAVATEAIQAGAWVSTTAFNLIPNTTYFIHLWTVDADGDASFMSTRATGTTLAVPPTLVPLPFVGVYDSSITVRWTPLPAAPPEVASMSAEGYFLEARKTNFGDPSWDGLSYTATTYFVTDNELTIGNVIPLEYCTTYYFRLGTLNWTDMKNYVTVGSRSTYDDKAVQISVNSIELGGIEMTASFVVSSGFLVVNTGTCPVDYELSVSNLAPATPWTFGPGAGVDVVSMRAGFNDTEPDRLLFTGDHLLTTGPVRATSTRFALGQNAVAVPRTASRKLWVRIDTPTITSTLDTQKLNVTVKGVTP